MFAKLTWIIQNDTISKDEKLEKAFEFSFHTYRHHLSTLALIRQVKQGGVMIAEKELISLAEAAKIIGVGVSTAYRYAWRGLLPVAMRTPTGTMRVRRADAMQIARTPMHVGTRRKSAT